MSVNMGAGGSTGQTNDELVDNLMRLGYVWNKDIERAFRLVDRGNYVTPSHKANAYKDIAWKHGNIHLSSPCIYGEVLEILELEPGLSFLNIGSGTGYLSTMAGLLLSSHGINHGIELHEECLNYAYEKLEEFKQKSVAVDAFEFCEPVFVQGNCLNVVPNRQYDRVYCGAACPEYYKGFIKQFVTVGGVLVMPTEDHLLRLQRLSDNTWTVQNLLPVSFATLIVPPDGDRNVVHLPDCAPRSLQEICRDGIRRCLRKIVWHEHNDLMTTGAIIQFSFLSHYRLSPSERLESDFIFPTFDVELDSSASDDDGEDFQPVTDLLQSNPDYTVDAENSTDLEINNHSNEQLEMSYAHPIVNNQDRAQEGDITEQRDPTSQSAEISERRNSATSERIMDLYVNSNDKMNNWVMKNTHQVDDDTFRAYMTEKIFKLPLPLPLKMYINYNRKL